MNRWLDVPIRRQQQAQIEIDREVVAQIARLVLKQVVDSIQKDVIPVLNSQLAQMENRLTDVESKVNRIIAREASYEEEVKKMAMEMMRETLTMQMETIFKVMKTGGGSVNVEPLVERIDVMEKNVTRRLDEMSNHMDTLAEANMNTIKTLAEFTDNLNDTLRKMVASILDETRKMNVKLLNTIDKKLASSGVKNLADKVDANYAMMQRLQEELSMIAELRSQLTALNGAVNRLHEEVARLNETLATMGEGGG